MVQEVTEKELITVTIDKYTDLQRIKKQMITLKILNLIIKLGLLPLSYPAWA